MNHIRFRNEAESRGLFWRIRPVILGEAEMALGEIIILYAIHHDLYGYTIKLTYYRYCEYY
jgi:hypothetical protein